MAQTKNHSKKPAAQGESPLAVCACNNLRRASRAVTQYYDDMLQATGLRSTQLVILLAVMQNDSAAGIAQLARNLGMDASTLNRNLRPLTQRRLVSIGKARSGGRKTVGLTETGRKAIQDATPHWQAAQRQLVGQLGEDRYRSLLADLGSIVDATREASSAT